MSGKYDSPPPSDSKTLASNISIRAATIDDVKGMTSLFFNAFLPSHKFFESAFPESLSTSWWDDAWRLGIEDPTARTYIAVDTSIPESQASRYAVQGGRIIAFARWIVPQHDGSLDRMWPDLFPDADTDILGPFFGGMEVNREHLMGSKPHWYWKANVAEEKDLEMLGTDNTYQRMGLGSVFMKWGCDFADQEDMQVYINASEKGAPFYQKHFGLLPRADIDLPVRPETYGSFAYVSLVRPSLSERQKPA